MTAAVEWSYKFCLFTGFMGDSSTSTSIKQYLFPQRRRALPIDVSRQLRTCEFIRAGQRSASWLVKDFKTSALAT